MVNNALPGGHGGESMAATMSQVVKDQSTFIARSAQSQAQRATDDTNDAKIKKGEKISLASLDSTLAQPNVTAHIDAVVTSAKYASDEERFVAILYNDDLMRHSLCGCVRAPPAGSSTHSPARRAAAPHVLVVA